MATFPNIDPLPPAPNPDSPATFNSLAYPFTAAMQVLSNEMNAFTTMLNGSVGDVGLDVLGAETQTEAQTRMGGTTIGRGVFAAATPAAASSALGITSVGTAAGGSYIDIQVGAQKWRLLQGSVAKTPDAFGEFEVTYGFSFLFAPFPVVSNGDASAESNIILSALIPEVGGFWVAARNLSGGAHLGAFRVNFFVFGRIA